MYKHDMDDAFDVLYDLIVLRMLPSKGLQAHLLGFFMYEIVSLNKEPTLWAENGRNR